MLLFDIKLKEYGFIFVNLKFLRKDVYIVILFVNILLFIIIDRCSLNYVFCLYIRYIDC